MIGRIWHGWTKPGNADAYEALLKSVIVPSILGKNVDGFQRIELFRRPLGAEVEFITIMWFESLAAVTAFAGEQYEEAVVPPAARDLLERFDERSQHYEVREVREVGQRAIAT
jgi:antibiotic biosynthesis monooxygenase (ABM) superfamily enzyme